VAACTRSGLIKKRSRALEKAWAQVFREAGARVEENKFIRDLGLGTVLPTDGRQIEIVAYGLPFFHGVPICADTTLVSPLSGQGTPTHRSDVVPGAALANAERRKARTYPELVGRGRARLVVLGCAVGGRWSNEALATVPLLAAHRASSAPELLRPSVIQACLSRWWSLLSVAAQSTLASTMCGDAGAYFGFAAETPLTLGGLLDHGADDPQGSRLPAGGTASLA
jgi:hypothetical protein